MILETDASSIAAKVAANNADSGAPLSEQVMNISLTHLYLPAVVMKVSGSLLDLN